jgi:hypothetical protein
VGGHSHDPELIGISHQGAHSRPQPLGRARVEEQAILAG